MRRLVEELLAGADLAAQKSVIKTASSDRLGVMLLHRFSPGFL